MRVYIDVYRDSNVVIMKFHGLQSEKTKIEERTWRRKGVWEGGRACP